jgi:hypothetical protein
MTTLYSGIALGGPFDGKPIYHGLPVMKQAHVGGRYITWFGPPTDTIEVGEYHHDGKRWIWKEK